MTGDSRWIPLAIAAALVAVLAAACGSGQPAAATKAHAANHDPAFVKPKVFVVGRAHHHHPRRRRPPVHARHRPVRRHVTHVNHVSHRRAAGSHEGKALTHAFPIGKHHLCCAARTKRGR